MQWTKLHVPKPSYLSPETSKVANKLLKRASAIREGQKEHDDARREIESVPLTEVVDTSGLRNRVEELLASELKLRYDLREYFPMIKEDQQSARRSARRTVRDRLEEVQDSLRELGFTSESLHGIITFPILASKHPDVAELERVAQSFNDDVQQYTKTNNEAIAVIEHEIQRRRRL